MPLLLRFHALPFPLHLRYLQVPSPALQICGNVPEFLYRHIWPSFPKVLQVLLHVPHHTYRQVHVPVHVLQNHFHHFHIRLSRYEKDFLPTLLQLWHCNLLDFLLRSLYFQSLYASMLRQCCLSAPYFPLW